jgi:hypothetical protein
MILLEICKAVQRTAKQPRKIESLEDVIRIWQISLPLDRHCV